MKKKRRKEVNEKKRKKKEVNEKNKVIGTRNDKIHMKTLKKIEKGKWKGEI